jgi:hypothetical protein
MSVLSISFTDFQDCLIAKIGEILGGTVPSESLEDEGGAVLYDESGAFLTDVGKQTGMVFKKADGSTVIGATGYRQQLPRLVQDDDDADQFFPYYIVRLETGHTLSDNEPWDVTVDILLGIFDDDTENDGHIYISEMIQRITDYFVAYPLLDHKYRALQDMDFALQDEDTYPYFFGGIEMKFWVQKARREDPYA